MLFRRDAINENKLYFACRKMYTTYKYSFILSKTNYTVVARSPFAQLHNFVWSYDMLVKKNL